MIALLSVGLALAQDPAGLPPAPGDLTWLWYALTALGAGLGTWAAPRAARQASLRMRGEETGDPPSELVTSPAALTAQLSQVLVETAQIREDLLSLFSQIQRLQPARDEAGVPLSVRRAEAQTQAIQDLTSALREVLAELRSA